MCVSNRKEERCKVHEMVTKQRDKHDRKEWHMIWSGQCEADFLTQEVLSRAFTRIRQYIFGLDRAGQGRAGQDRS